MTANFLIALAELLRECPSCHKITLDEGKLDMSSNKIIRTCKCGYSIELDIKEGINVVPRQKILVEDDKHQKKGGN